MLTSRSTKRFLSTPSVWRATFVFKANSHAASHFYPRPPCGGRPGNSLEADNLHAISIHALRVEGDGRVLMGYNPKTQFLSTPSVWRATGCTFWHTNDVIFLSTPSVWRATYSDVSSADALVFLSTPSVWRATIMPYYNQLFESISIHALRVEGDLCQL